MSLTNPITSVFEDARNAAAEYLIEQEWSVADDGSNDGSTDQFDKAIQMAIVAFFSDNELSTGIIEPSKLGELRTAKRGGTAEYNVGVNAYHSGKQYKPRASREWRLGWLYAAQLDTGARE